MLKYFVLASIALLFLPEGAIAIPISYTPPDKVVKPDPKKTGKSGSRFFHNPVNNVKNIGGEIDS